MAVATEQQMVARTKENQAAVVLAEAGIPEAMAVAFREGQLRGGVTQQYRGNSIRRRSATEEEIKHPARVHSNSKIWIRRTQRMRSRICDDRQ